MYDEALTRIEELKINLKLNYDGAVRHRDDVKLVLGNSPDVCTRPGETKEINYKFWVEYLGRTEEKLKAINRIIADESAVVTCSIDELNYGRSLIVSVVAQLTRIIDRLEGTTPPPKRSPWYSRWLGQ